MAGYSATPLWKKLGYRTGLRAVVQGAPAGYKALLALPSDVTVSFGKAIEKDLAFLHVFTASRAELAAALRVVRKAMAPDGIVWVSWPKKASGIPSEVTEDTVRELALPIGLVDIKVCAVDDTWSGLKLMIRKSER